MDLDDKILWPLTIDDFFSSFLLLSVLRMVDDECDKDHSASAAFFAFVNRRDARGLGHSSC
jgi:hypothetical protein